MTLRSLLLYGRLLRGFRNGWSMIRTVRGGPPCKSALLWDGTRISHPPGRSGLVDIIIELWLEQPYTRDGFYQPADGDVIVDAGANVGVFSIWVSRQNPHCRVIALEPFAENFAYLEANLHAARLGVERVKPHQIALGPTFGQGRMTDTGNRSLDHTITMGGETAGVGTVPVIPLSGLFELTQTERISLLKVDIEGSEHDAFGNAEPNTLRRFDRIAIEYHDNLRPGTLALLQARLEPTHHCITRASTVEGCGILLATRRTDEPGC